MVRAPCCDKVGLKKGPWTPEEDKILVAYVRQHGHGNWRALPKLAGLMRCGKSCRLRWINYLRPDIKRGNFSREEEDAIIELHEKLGNKWSAIAARLPGRTDNEIKNVWHTHLKKKLKKIKAAAPDARGHSSAADVSTSDSDSFNSIGKMSPQPSSSSEFSSDSSTRTNTTEMENEQMDYSPEQFPEIDESFWSDVLSSGNSGMTPYFPAPADDLQLQSSQEIVYGDQTSNIIDDGMDFWYDVFIRSGGFQELA